MRSHAVRAGSAAALAVLIAAGIAVPVQAAMAPGAKITAVPDGGARPQTSQVPLLPAGDLSVPKGPTIDPLLALSSQVSAAQAESGMLSERINEREEELDRSKLSQAWAMHVWMQASNRLTVAKQQAATVASSAYMSKDKLPGTLQNDGLLGDLLQLRPGTAPAGQGAAYELAKATEAEYATRTALRNADAQERAAAQEVAAAVELFTQRDQGRMVLEQRLTQLTSQEALKRERETANLAAGYNAGQSNAGLMAHPEARKAVLFALQQLGKPWRFAEEGPDYFDCSGLTQTSFRQGGVLLPRVANDQYFAYRAKPVALGALLPGDLLFYARDPKDWQTIHHVMIYLGTENGVHKIVHSPRLGDVVKVSSINLGPGNQVDFTARVIDAVEVPQQPPAPAPSPTPTPSPTPSASPTPASTMPGVPAGA